MRIIEEARHQYRMGGMLQKLIIWNIAGFFVALIFFYKFSQGIFVYPEWLAQSSDYKVALTHIWTLVTYPFYHAGAIHLIFNMIILNFSGRLFYTFFTDRQLQWVYMLGGAFAGMVYVVVYSIFPLGSALMVGASASIMAVLFAAVTYSPFMQVRMLLIGYVRLWHIAVVILVLDVLQIGVTNTGGHVAHLAGALFGFIFVKLLNRGTDLSAIGARIGGYFLLKNIRKRRKNKKTSFKKVYVNTDKKTGGTKYTHPKHEKDKNQQQVDEILDKISRSGYDSLTKEEKEFLFRQ
ncbi:MAG TPA: rhomboid family intramembrane serine protease [Flavobacterium sp.]|nr:rhomboid family intramembrane serine protease [Flavobacterium sp.]